MPNKNTTPRNVLMPNAPRRLHRVSQSALVLAVIVRIGLFDAAPTLACPFCQAVKPSFAQQRESAATVLLAEVAKKEGEQVTFRIHRALRDNQLLPSKESLSLKISAPLKVGGLVILTAQGSADMKYEAWEWTALPVNETSAAYFVRTPDLRMKNPDRLKNFAKYLENADSSIAEDAFLEFGHAPFDEVQQVADSLPQAKLRDWINDAQIPDGRQGFYGLALGLAKDATDRRANRELLQTKIAEKKTDFRAGFDGLLAGYLLLEKDTALADVSEKFFANRDAAGGDVRHAHAALRFYYEFGRDIPKEKLAAALRPAILRSEISAAVITDLARWKDWESLISIVGLYDQKEFSAPDIRTAIIGYLSVCPLPTAATELDRLKKFDPDGVRDALERFTSLSGGK